MLFTARNARGPLGSGLYHALFTPDMPVTKGIGIGVGVDVHGGGGVDAGAGADVGVGVGALTPVGTVAGSRNVGGGLRMLAAIGGATTVDGDGEALNDLGCVGGVALGGPDLAIVGGGGVPLLPALVLEISPSSAVVESTTLPALVLEISPSSAAASCLACSVSTPLAGGIGTNRRRSPSGSSS